MLLKTLLSELKYKRFSGEIDKPCEELFHDSRKVVPGGAFIALKGYTVDGHQYIADVIAKGVSIIFCQEDGIIQENEGVTYVYFDDTQDALPTIAAKFYGFPANQLTMIGVTGTNGKTSIALMLETMLKAEKYRTALIGTIHNKIGDVIYETANTTPDALNLNRFLYQAVNEGVTHCLMEVSSHALKLDRVRHISYDYGLFTNLTEDHLDFHPDFEDYFLSKAMLFERAEKGIVINIDDPYGQRLVAEKRYKVPLLTYGFNREADITVEHVVYEPSGTNCIFITPVGSFDATIAIPGDIYVLNTMTCLGVLCHMGFDLNQLKSAVGTIKPVRGRLERVADRNVIVDYAHTPDALENVIKVVRKFTSGRVITVFGCGGDRDRKKRPLMGSIAQKGSDIVIVTSDNPRTESVSAIIDDIFEGITLPESDVYRIDDRKTAIEKALDMMAPDDTVLIAGKGHETYQIIGREKIHFDDAEIVREFFNK